MSRYNTFYDQIQDGYGGHIDAHDGITSVEAYNNTMYGAAVDARGITPTGIYSPDTMGRYISRGFQIRGGSALVYANRLVDVTRNSFYSDYPSSPSHVDYVWAWSNDIAYPNSDAPSQDFAVSVDVTHVYFRPVSLQQDGFTYTPYPYPHPLIAARVQTPLT